VSQELAQHFDLTDRQASLLEGILQGKNVEQARDAGYAGTTLVGRMLRNSPAVAAALDYEIPRRLQFEGAPLAALQSAGSSRA
jgi:hypothetical protein